MTQKQIIGLILGVLGLGLVFAFVYRQFAEQGSSQMQGQPKTAVSDQEKKAAIPVTIDDISATIQAETDADLSALDDEADGEISDIEADSDSVNNLGTSYDENSL
ncbi:MAG: hypothetical protein WAW00_01860 [Candidatus Moraniibacteriota bacterium]